MLSGECLGLFAKRSIFSLSGYIPREQRHWLLKTLELAWALIGNQMRFGENFILRANFSFSCVLYKGQMYTHLKWQGLVGKNGF